MCTNHNWCCLNIASLAQGVVAGGQNGSATVWSSQSGKILRTLVIPPATCLALQVLSRSRPDYAPDYLMHPSSVNAACRAEVIRCVSDRFSNVVGTMTTAGIMIWGP
jgi:hypothetical protein